MTIKSTAFYFIYSEAYLLVNISDSYFKKRKKNQQLQRSSPERIYRSKWNTITTLQKLIVKKQIHWNTTHWQLGQYNFIKCITLKTKTNHKSNVMRDSSLPISKMSESRGPWSLRNKSLRYWTDIQLQTKNEVCAYP